MTQGDWFGIATILAIVAFCGVCIWAWSDKRRQQFDEAANLPFADEDSGGTKKGKSDE